MLGKCTMHNAQCKWWIYKKFLHIVIWTLSSKFKACGPCTMANLIVSLDGTRFQFSHSLRNLLVSQLEATLEGLPVHVRIRTTKVDEKHTCGLTRSARITFIISHMLNQSALTKWWRLTKKLFNQNGLSKHFWVPRNVMNIIPTEDDDLSTLSVHLNAEQASSDMKLDFLRSHPDHHFTTLSKLQNWAVPRMYYDGGRMCTMVKRRLHDNDCDKKHKKCRKTMPKLLN